MEKHTTELELIQVAMNTTKSKKMFVRYQETNIPIEQALEMVYNSIVFEKLSQVDTGLYRESSSYAYELLKDEIDGKKLIQKKI